ncbi:sodium/glutamate symporter [Corallincola spongiicola]|uniref:Sodium/glutamate symporter n=1 Tax=Corallincola spongiicola TaxID=2520508 RepID=A0ABY1WQX4_9GAMM|nr:sodium/glutamate symporter [Corallincola spongiicola]TAA47122.1 sodium/glutamate symporter [Corallincola spongiicola]
METTYQIGALHSFILVILVLFIGRALCSSIAALKKFNIPEPIVGGLVVAVLVTVLKYQGIQVEFSVPMKDILMLFFFSAVGLSASYKMLLKGGRQVFVLLLLAMLFLILQNAVGVGLAATLGLDPLMGLVAGSISLSGGHGTGAAWSQTFAENYGLNTMEFAMAAATFGLIIGGVVGGPVGQGLINKYKLREGYNHKENHHLKDKKVMTYDRREEDRVSATNLAEILFLLLLCAVGAMELQTWVVSLDIPWLNMPQFVYALFIGVVLSNLLDVSKLYTINNEVLDVVSTLCLTLFLAMALMSLKLWELFNLALPLLVILVAQTLLVITFVVIVTFRAMGKSYDAAIISAGQCGFGMGATPTAVMNMSALTARNGPSPQAFIVVPVVGAFFIDIVNLIVLQGYIGFLD